MHILMLAKEKGGAGASTLARELGVVAVAHGQRVVFIDLDPQASLSKWWNRRTAGDRRSNRRKGASIRTTSLRGSGPR